MSITVPNFMTISQTTAEIWPLKGFQTAVRHLGFLTVRNFSS